jgi:hypothetical protein
MQNRQQRTLERLQTPDDRLGSACDIRIHTFFHADSSASLDYETSHGREQRLESMQYFRDAIENFYQTGSERANTRASCSSAETIGVCGSRGAAIMPTMWWASGSTIGTARKSPSTQCFRQVYRHDRGPFAGADMGKQHDHGIGFQCWFDRGAGFGRDAG